MLDKPNRLKNAIPHFLYYSKIVLYVDVHLLVSITPFNVLIELKMYSDMCYSGHYTCIY